MTVARERVLGFGGFFFRSEDPHMLAAWYESNLGVSLTPDDYSKPSWHQSAGSTVFQPFEQDTGYFGNPSKQWMLNFRVANLDAMVAQLRGNGIDVTVDGTQYPNGKFARLADPEGNPVELWEEMDAAPAHE